MAEFDIYGDNVEILVAFDMWLYSDEWYDALFSEESRKSWSFVQEIHPDCFLDLVTLWLIHGHGYRHFPTFETFLLAVIDLIDEWRKHDTDPDERDGRTRFVFGLLSPLSSDSRDTNRGRIINDVHDGQERMLASDHPVLNRTRWEQNRQQYLAGIDHRKLA